MDNVKELFKFVWFQYCWIYNSLNLNHTLFEIHIYVKKFEFMFWVLRGSKMSWFILDFT